MLKSVEKLEWLPIEFDWAIKEEGEKPPHEERAILLGSERKSRLTGQEKVLTQDGNARLALIAGGVTQAFDIEISSSGPSELQQ